MTRANTVRAVLAIAVLAVSGWLVANRPPNLGLDLRGGTQIVLETRDGPLAKASADNTDEALSVLRRRIDQLGVSEPVLTRSGERRIIVELPGVTDPAAAIAVLGRTAQLTFHPVEGTATSGGIPDEDGRASLTLGPAAIDGALIDEARAVPGQFGGWTIDITFRDRGPDAWQKLTGDAACAPVGDPKRRVAIVLDGKIISSPQVNPEIACDVGITGGRTSITGSFTSTQAKDLALLIRAGGLPVPVELIEQRTVGPSLGADAIEASARAAVLGLVATILFIVAVYRLVGGLAAIALVAYGLISYAALLAIDATLTLPGLAGFVLAIGMAVDANVLVFERAREEFATGRASLGKSMTVGFTRAWTAIIDSNITTLLAAGLLFFLAAGPVQGFGVTLSIGVVVSMFTALVLTRLLTGWMLRRRVVAARPRLTGLGGIGAVRRWLEERGPDLMGRRKLWLAISATLVVVALLGIGLRGLDWGVEFTGGRLVEYSTSQPVSVEQAREAAAEAGLSRAIVTRSGADNVSVRAGSFDDGVESRLRAELASVGGTVERQRDERIGPSLGAELRTKAMIALGVALAAQLAYLAIRFRWQWAAATVLAMLHDVVLLVGAFAWFGRPVDGVFLAAVLTVIGYSVNDTVVVFDRIRELVRAPGGPGPAPAGLTSVGSAATEARREGGAERARGPRERSERIKQSPGFAALANLGCLQTVPRTVNTGLGALFVLVALAVLGQDSLVDFAVALLIGILAGTYSSVFLAAPLAIVFESRKGGLVARLARRAPAQSRRRPRPRPTTLTPTAVRKG